MTEEAPVPSPHPKEVSDQEFRAAEAVFALTQAVPSSASPSKDSAMDTGDDGDAKSDESPDADGQGRRESSEGVGGDSSSINKATDKSNALTTEKRPKPTAGLIPSPAASKASRPSGSNKKKGSRYKGVGFDTKSNKWKTRVHYDGKDIMVGTFESEGEAALAYDSKARELWGSQAVTNFDDNGDFNPNAKSTIQGSMIKAKMPAVGGGGGGGDGAGEARAKPPRPSTEDVKPPASDPSPSDGSRRYPKRGDSMGGGPATNGANASSSATDPSTLISEPPLHRLIMPGPAVPPAASGQAKRKSSGTGGDSKKKRPASEDGFDDSGDEDEKVPLSRDGGRQKSARHSASGSSSRDTAIVMREAAQILLRRMMESTELGNSAAYDRAMQFFYKEKQSASLLVESVMQAMGSAPGGRGR